MAERAGFEPAMEFDPHTRLAGECLQPLGHLSGSRCQSRAERAAQRVACPRRGRVAERLNAAVLKTVRRATPVSGVRIPPLPFAGANPKARQQGGGHEPSRVGGARRMARATARPVVLVGLRDRQVGPRGTTGPGGYCSASNSLVAFLFCSPRIEVYLPLAEFAPPPLTDESSPLATFSSPPATHARMPEARLSAPPPTDAPSSVGGVVRAADNRRALCAGVVACAATYPRGFAAGDVAQAAADRGPLGVGFGAVLRAAADRGGIAVRVVGFPSGNHIAGAEGLVVVAGDDSRVFAFSCIASATQHRREFPCRLVLQSAEHRSERRRSHSWCRRGCRRSS